MILKNSKVQTTVLSKSNTPCDTQKEALAHENNPWVVTHVLKLKYCSASNSGPYYYNKYITKFQKAIIQIGVIAIALSG